MLPSDPVAETRSLDAPEEQLAREAREGQRDAFVAIMRRYNQRMYRAARAIVRDEGEAEDVVQQAYVYAYLHLRQFRGDARLSTWLTRIVINEALARMRLSRRNRDLGADGASPAWCSGRVAEESPEERVSREQLARLLEHAIDTLPHDARLMLVLRDVEGLSTQEAAECLCISEQAARVRLHRARALVRDELVQRVGSAERDVFRFEGERCQRIVAGVLARLTTP